MTNVVMLGVAEVLFLNLKTTIKIVIKISMSQIQQKPPVGSTGDQKWVDLVVQHVKSLRYGVVEIVVHDSRVIQIEKTERMRLDKTESRAD